MRKCIGEVFAPPIAENSRVSVITPCGNVQIISYHFLRRKRVAVQ